jgi:hypothetical protein
MGAKSLAAVFSSTVGIKVMVLVIEAVEKRSILLDHYRYSSPEVTSGIYSRKPYPSPSAVSPLRTSRSVVVYARIHL